jgi:hypothetical protein
LGCVDANPALLKEQSFNPDDISLLSSAFEETFTRWASLIAPFQ